MTPTVSDLSAFANLRHPQFFLLNSDWNKWRLTMAGGQLFLNAYLKQYSDREDSDDFTLRKSMSYCSGYAKSAVREIINAVFQRMRDITRTGGPETYVNAVEGRNGGVNREGMSMNMFMGTKILPELLAMGKVGVYVDMPDGVEGRTLAETYGAHPYLYYYPVENILNWNYTNQELRAVLLRDEIYSYDPVSGMPNGTMDRYRYIWKDELGKIFVKTFSGVMVDQKFEVLASQDYQLSLKEIPFVIVDIGESLLTDVADHQIALTNLESSDVNYLFQANFPMYTEQENTKIKPSQGKDKGENPNDVAVGVMKGRRYPMEADRPGYIHPSSEPLQAAMKKEDEIKNEIRHLVHLAVNKLNPQRESADSKALDNEGLEAGLAFIGLTLENAENFISARWAEYSGSLEISTVKYPSQYSLLSDDQRRAAAKSTFEMRDDVPSTKGRKELTKLAVRTLFDGRVSPKTLDSILDEIDRADYVSGRAEDIVRDEESGLVDKDTASQARGYKKGLSDKAKNEHFERLKFIADTQTAGGAGGRSLPDNPAARGLPDAAGDKQGAKDEKKGGNE